MPMPDRSYLIPRGRQHVYGSLSATAQAIGYAIQPTSKSTFYQEAAN